MTTALHNHQLLLQQVVQEEQRPVSQPSFERQPNLTIMKHLQRATTRVRPAAAALNKHSQLWCNWDLRRDNISRPETGQLDTLTMSTFLK